MAESHWEAIEQALQGLVRSASLDERGQFGEKARAAVGEAKRREAEQAVRTSMAEARVAELLDGVCVEDRCNAELERLRARAAELERDCQVIDAMVKRVSEVERDRAEERERAKRWLALYESGVDTTAELERALRELVDLYDNAPPSGLLPPVVDAAYARARGALGARREATKHTQECDDNRLIHHASTGDDADCICGARREAGE